MQLLSSTQRGAIARDILEVAEADYLHVLRSIASEEINAQVGMGNSLTLLKVDGKKATSVDHATRSVQAFFADRSALLGAFRDAWQTLAANGRRVTGRTIGKMTFHYRLGMNGPLVQVRDVSAIIKQTPNPGALDLYATIMVPHVRAWQWFSATGRRLKRRTRNKLLLRRAKAMKEKAFRVSNSVFEKTANQVQRRFPTMDVDFIYLRVPDLGTGDTPIDRIPAIKVNIATRLRVQ
jgi:hypothetical protein